MFVCLKALYITCTIPMKWIWWTCHVSVVSTQFLTFLLFFDREFGAYYVRWEWKVCHCCTGWYKGTRLLRNRQLHWLHCRTIGVLCMVASMSSQVKSWDYKWCLHWSRYVAILHVTISPIFRLCVYPNRSIDIWHVIVDLILSPLSHLINNYIPAVVFLQLTVYWCKWVTVNVFEICGITVASAAISTLYFYSLRSFPSDVFCRTECVQVRKEQHDT